MSADDLLRKYRRSRVLLDQEPVKNDLLADLRAEKSFNNRRYMAILTAVTILYIIAMIALAADLIGNQAARLTIFAGSGIGIPFILNFMRSVASEWSKTNLLITLISHSDESSIQSLIDKLLSSEAVGLSAPGPKTKSQP
jgi:hypothetical protein